MKIALTLNAVDFQGATGLIYSCSTADQHNYLLKLL